MERTYKYLGYFMLLLIPLTFAGFYRTYFGLFPEFKNIQMAHHFHGAVAGLWIGLLVIQPFLIQSKKMEWHRWLGKFSYVVFPVLIISFLMMITIQTPTLESAFIPAADMTLITLFYGLAIVNRNNSGAHMRYMISSSLVLINPTVGRFFIAAYGIEKPMWFHILFAIIYTILVSLILYDRAHGRNYKPYVVAVCGFLIYEICFHVVYIM